MRQGLVSYGVADAELCFRELIARVGARERVTIVRRGTPVAVVVPPDQWNTERPAGLAAAAGRFSDFPDLDEIVGKRSDSTNQAPERT